MTVNSGIVTKQTLKGRSGEFDLESIHSLNLSSLEITDMGCLGECSSLERLDLSQNDITKLYSLASLTSLVYLNLSANRITCLDGLQALDSLVTLNLAGNLIGSVDALRTISCLEKFTDLRLADTIHKLTNPVCMNVSYKKDATEILPMLVTLDGEKLKGKGSDLFKLCTELDKEIESSTSCSSTQDVDAVSWKTDNMWKVDTKEFNESQLADAEDQLNMLLESCKSLSEEAALQLTTTSKDTPS